MLRVCSAISKSNLITLGKVELLRTVQRLQTIEKIAGEHKMGKNSSDKKKKSQAASKTPLMNKTNENEGADAEFGEFQVGTVTTPETPQPAVHSHSFGPQNLVSTPSQGQTLASSTDSKIYVGNLTTNVCVADITQFLQLDLLCSVQMIADKNHCFVFVHDSLVESVLNKNGKELFGRLIRVELAESTEGEKEAEKTPERMIPPIKPGAPTKTQMNEQQGPSSTETNVELTNELCIKFRGYLRLFELKAFYAAKKMKQQMVEDDKIKTKIYTDSTLRNVDTLGLSADVCTMSGGGIGQVIQASLDDPNNIQQENIIIMGGTNDKKQQNFDTIEMFAANIDMSLGKLGEAAEQAPEKTFHLVHQIPLNETGGDDVEEVDVSLFQTKEERIQNCYLQKRIHELSENVSNIECFLVQYDADPTGHPSDSGTIQILRQIHNQKITPEPLIWNEDFIFTPKPYKQVESIYRYGCNVCNRYGSGLSRVEHSHQLLCDVCFVDVQERAALPNHLLRQTTDRIVALEQQISEQSFPPAKRYRSAEVDGGEKGSETMEITV